MEFSDLFPHVPGPASAEGQFALDFGLKCLNVMKHQRECDQAGGDRHRTEGDREKCGRPQTAAVGRFRIVNGEIGASH
jgi:hypothetical protein